MEPINFTTESPVTNMKISTTVKAPVPRVKLNKTSSSESEEEKDENISKVMIRYPMVLKCK